MIKHTLTIPVDFNKGSDRVKIALVGTPASYGRTHHRKRTVGTDRVTVELLIDVDALGKYFAEKLQRSSGASSRGMGGMIKAKRKQVKRLRETITEVELPQGYEVVP